MTYKTFSKTLSQTNTTDKIQIQQFIKNGHLTDFSWGQTSDTNYKWNEINGDLSTNYDITVLGVEPVVELIQDTPIQGIGSEYDGSGTNHKILSPFAIGGNPEGEWLNWGSDIIQYDSADDLYDSIEKYVNNYKDLDDDLKLLYDKKNGIANNKYTRYYKFTTDLPAGKYCSLIGNILCSGDIISETNVFCLLSSVPIYTKHSSFSDEIVNKYNIYDTSVKISNDDIDTYIGNGTGIVYNTSSVQGNDLTPDINTDLVKNLIYKGYDNYAYLRKNNTIYYSDPTDGTILYNIFDKSPYCLSDKYAASSFLEPSTNYSIAGSTNISIATEIDDTVVYIPADSDDWTSSLNTLNTSTLDYLDEVYSFFSNINSYNTLISEKKQIFNNLEYFNKYGKELFIKMYNLKYNLTGDNALTQSTNVDDFLLNNITTKTTEIQNKYDELQTIINSINDTTYYNSIADTYNYINNNNCYVYKEHDENINQIEFSLLSSTNTLSNDAGYHYLTISSSEQATGQGDTIDITQDYVVLGKSLSETDLNNVYIDQDSLYKHLYYWTPQVGDYKYNESGTLFWDTTNASQYQVILEGELKGTFDPSVDIIKNNEEIKVSDITYVINPDDGYIYDKGTSLPLLDIDGNYKYNSNYANIITFSTTITMSELATMISNKELIADEIIINNTKLYDIVSDSENNLYLITPDSLPELEENSSSILFDYYANSKLKYSELYNENLDDIQIKQSELLPNGEYPSEGNLVSKNKIIKYYDDIDSNKIQIASHNIIVDDIIDNKINFNNKSAIILNDYNVDDLLDNSNITIDGSIKYGRAHEGDKITAYLNGKQFSTTLDMFLRFSFELVVSDLKVGDLDIILESHDVTGNIIISKLSDDTSLYNKIFYVADATQAKDSDGRNIYYVKNDIKVYHENPDTYLDNLNKIDHVSNNREILDEDDIIYYGIIKSITSTGIVFDDPFYLYSSGNETPYVSNINLPAFAKYYNRELRNSINGVHATTINEINEYVAGSILYNSEEFKYFTKNMLVSSFFNNEPILYDGDGYYSTKYAQPILDNNYKLLYNTTEGFGEYATLNESGSFPEISDLVCEGRILEHDNIVVSSNADTMNRLFSHENNQDRLLIVDNNYVYSILNSSQATRTKINNLLVMEQEINNELYYTVLSNDKKDNLASTGLVKYNETTLEYDTVYTSYLYYINNDMIVKINDNILYSTDNAALLEYNSFLSNSLENFILDGFIMSEEQKANIISDNVITVDYNNEIKFSSYGVAYYKEDYIEPAKDNNGKSLYYPYNNQAIYKQDLENESIIYNNRKYNYFEISDIIVSDNIVVLDNFGNITKESNELLYSKLNKNNARNAEGKLLYNPIAEPASFIDSFLDPSEYVSNMVELNNLDGIIVHKENNKIFNTNVLGASVLKINDRYQYTILDTSVHATLDENNNIPAVYSITSENEQMLDDNNIIWDKETKELFEYDETSVQLVDENNNKLWITEKANQAKLDNYGNMNSIDQLVCDNKVMTSSDNIIIYSFDKLLFDKTNGIQATNENNELLFLISGATHLKLNENFEYPLANQMIITNENMDNILLTDNDLEYVVPDTSGNLYYTKGLIQLKDNQNNFLYSTIGAKQAGLIDNNYPDVSSMIALNRELTNQSDLYVENDLIYYTKYAPPLVNPYNNKPQYNTEYANQLLYDKNVGIPSFLFLISSRLGTEPESQENIVTDGTKIYDAYNKFALYHENTDILIYDNIKGSPLVLGDNIISVPEVSSLIADNREVVDINDILINENKLYYTKDAPINTDENGNILFNIIDVDNFVQIKELYAINDLKESLFNNDLISSNIEIKNFNELYIEQDSGSVYYNGNAQPIVDSDNIKYYDNYSGSIQAKATSLDINEIVLTELIQNSKPITDINLIEIHPITYELYSNIGLSESKDGDNLLYNRIYSTQATSINDVDNLEYSTDDLLIDYNTKVILLDNKDNLYIDDNNNIWDVRDSDITFVDGEAVFDLENAYKIYLKNESRLYYSLDECKRIYTKNSCIVRYNHLDCDRVYLKENTKPDYKISECKDVYLKSDCQLRYEYTDCYLIYSKSNCMKLYNTKDCEIVYSKDTCKKSYNLNYAKIIWDRNTCQNKYIISTCSPIYEKDSCKKDCDLTTCKKVYIKNTLDPIWDITTLLPVYLKSECSLTYFKHELDKLYYVQDCIPCYLKNDLKKIYTEQTSDVCYDIEQAIPIYLESSCTKLYDIDLCLPVYKRNDDHLLYSVHECEKVYTKESTYPVYLKSKINPIYHKNNCELAYNITDSNLYKVYDRNDCHRRYDLSTCLPIYKKEDCFVKYNWEACIKLYDKSTCSMIPDIKTGIPVFKEETCKKLLQANASAQKLYIKPGNLLGAQEADPIYDVTTCYSLYKRSSCSPLYDYHNATSKYKAYDDEVANYSTYVTQNIRNNNSLRTMYKKGIFKYVSDPNNWINPINKSWQLISKKISCKHLSNTFTLNAEQYSNGYNITIPDKWTLK